MKTLAFRIACLTALLAAAAALTGCAGTRANAQPAGTPQAQGAGMDTPF